MAFSGVSASVVVVEDQGLWIAHVGDVRAVIGEESRPKLASSDRSRRRGSVGGRSPTTNLAKSPNKNVESRIIAHPLVVDHTPYREDERDRVLRMGAEISTLDVKDGYKSQLDQNRLDFYDDDEDPLRLFLPDKRYPAIPITRSIGGYM